jgi:hypothetical protein
VNAVLKQSLKGIFLAAVVLVAGSALAASKGSLELQHPTSVGGKQLATGNYTVQWDGTGDQVELKIFQGKNAVATTPARVVKVERRQPHNAAITVTNGDGTSSLSQIVFGGKDYALEVASEGGASGAAGAAR